MGFSGPCKIREASQVGSGPRVEARLSWGYMGRGVRLSWGMWKEQVGLGVHEGQADLKASRWDRAELGVCDGTRAMLGRHEGQADLRACGRGPSR